MNMRDYAVDDYGLLLDEETIKTIVSQLDGTEFSDEDDFGYILDDNGICEYISEFTGEAVAVEDNGNTYWGANAEAYNNDVILYVPLSKYPSLFKKVYESMEDIIQEFKEKLGKYLPDDYDYRSRIRHISGTYFG